LFVCFCLFFSNLHLSRYIQNSTFHVRSLICILLNLSSTIEYFFYTPVISHKYWFLIQNKHLIFLVRDRTQDQTPFELVVAPLTEHCAVPGGRRHLSPPLPCLRGAAPPADRRRSEVNAAVHSPIPFPRAAPPILPLPHLTLAALLCFPPPSNNSLLLP
jgi:hypothetical protein